LYRVARASRGKSTICSKPWRNSDLINADESDKNDVQHFHAAAKIGIPRSFKALERDFYTVVLVSRECSLVLVSGRAFVIRLVLPKQEAPVKIVSPNFLDDGEVSNPFFSTGSKQAMHRLNHSF